MGAMSVDFSDQGVLLPVDVIFFRVIDVVMQATAFLAFESRNG